MTTKITVETPEFTASQTFPDGTNHDRFLSEVNEVLAATVSLQDWTVTVTARPQDKR